LTVTTFHIKLKNEKMGSYKVNLMSVKTFGRRFTYTSFVFLEGILLLIHIKFKFWIEASEANSLT